MATTTMFALSNPGGKRVRIKSRKKATMARRRRRGRRNPSAKLTADELAFVTGRLGKRKRSRAAKKGARKRKARLARLRRARTAGKRKKRGTGIRARRAARARAARRRRAAARRCKNPRRRRRNPGGKRKYGIFRPSWMSGGKKAKRKSSKKGKSKGKRKSAKRVAAGKKAARTRAAKKAKRSAAGRKAARRAGKKGKRKGGARRKRSYGRRPKKGIYRPYARLRRGRRARFGIRTKKRMAALGLASVRGGKYSLNPRRRRRKNPMARRRSSRRRRNPFGVSVRGIRGLFTKGNAKKYAKLGVGAMLGMAVARGGPAILGRLPVVGGFLAPDTPIKAVIGSAVALGLGAMVARKVKIVPSDMVNAALVGGAGIVAAGILKILSARVPALRMIPGVSGMGDVVSPSQLVAGEAIFGGSGVGDYLQLSGPVPEQYFAGGLNDYVEFQNRAAGVAAEAASAAQVDWSPGTETSF